MTRSGLVLQLSAKHPSLTNNDVELVVSVILEALGKTLANGGRTEIRGFGSFGLNYRSPRKGRNPKTGEDVHIPAKYVLHFRAGRELKERVDRR